MFKHMNAMNNNYKNKENKIIYRKIKIKILTAFKEDINEKYSY